GGGMQVHRPVRDVQTGEGPFVQSRAGGGQPEHPHDGRALGAFVYGRNAADVVRRDPALLVGGTGERDRGFRAAYDVGDLHRVADGVNVRDIRLHAFVHQDVPAGAESDAAAFQESRVGLYPDGEDGEIGFKDVAVLQRDAKAVRSVRERGDRKSTRLNSSHVKISYAV